MKTKKDLQLEIECLKENIKALEFIKRFQRSRMEMLYAELEKNGYTVKQINEVAKLESEDK